jgi:hypothetical protein
MGKIGLVMTPKRGHNWVEVLFGIGIGIRAFRWSPNNIAVLTSNGMYSFGDLDRFF